MFVSPGIDHHEVGSSSYLVVYTTIAAEARLVKQAGYVRVRASRRPGKTVGGDYATEISWLMN